MKEQTFSSNPSSAFRCSIFPFCMRANVCLRATATYFFLQLEISIYRNFSRIHGNQWNHPSSLSIRFELNGFAMATDSSLALNRCPRDCSLTDEPRVIDVSGMVLLHMGSHGAMSSFIVPEGEVLAPITTADVTTESSIILAKKFRHFVLEGNDYLKPIDLLLDLEAKRVWIHRKRACIYSICSDLTEVGPIDVPVPAMGILPLLHIILFISKRTFHFLSLFSQLESACHFSPDSLCKC